MQLLPDAIRDGQTEFSTQPSYGLGIRTFGAPAAPTGITYGSLDWNRLWTGFYDGPTYTGYMVFNISVKTIGEIVGPQVCCTYAGTLIIIDINDVVHRYTNPGPDTDFSDWLGADTSDFVAETYYPNNGGLDACKIKSEIIQARGGFTPAFRISVDDGVSFGSNSPTFNDGLWTDLATPDYEQSGAIPQTTCMWVRVAYKYNSDDVAILGVCGGTNALVMWTRINGTWSGAPLPVPVGTYDQSPYTVAPSCPRLWLIGGTVPVLCSAELTYVPYGDGTGDWFVPMTVKDEGKDEDGAGSGNVHFRTMWAAFGNGGVFDYGQWYFNQALDVGGGNSGLKISDAYEEITSFGDFSYFNGGGIGTDITEKLKELENVTLTRSLGDWVPNGRMPTAGLTGEQAIAADMAAVNKNPSKFSAPAPWYEYAGDKQTVTYTPDLKANRLFNMLARQGNAVGQRIRTTTQTDPGYDYSAPEASPTNGLTRGMAWYGYDAEIPLAAGMQGYHYTQYIPGFGLIWEGSQIDKLLFYVMREDMTVKEAVFYKAYGLKAPYAMQMVYNDDYIFGVSGSYVYSAPKPKYWTVPTAGAGAGATTLSITREEILQVNVTEGVHTAADVELVLVNNTGKYAAPGTGAIANLKADSLVKVYGGLYSGGTEYLSEINEYFIYNYGYGRQDNLATFHIYCIDGWGKLEGYTFPNPVHFNELEYNPLYPTTRYNAYQIIEEIVNAIGCTLEYESRSRFITEFYPRLDIKTGTIGASIVRQLLSGKITDKLRFRGTRGILKNPLEGDDPVAHMLFPKYT